MLARELSDSSCEILIDREEWPVCEVAYKLYYEKKPPTKPSLKQMVSIIAQLGGHMGRKGGDGDPGVKTIWRGLL